MDHELTLIGSKINHLPAAVFHLYAILQQSYIGQYEETGDCVLIFRKEDNVYASDETLMTPENATVAVAYEELTEAVNSCKYRYCVRMMCAGHTHMLTMPCGIAFLQQYYYPVRRFLRANPAKFVRPGTPHPPREGMMIAVLDTEMQRPYITQFSGCMLRFHNGAWTMDDTQRFNVYVRLPEGVPMDPYVRKVTGLTRAFLDANGVEEEEALDQITAFLSQAELVCGHAVLSDVELLRERYLLAGRIPDPSVLRDAAARDLLVGDVAGAANALDTMGVMPGMAEHSPDDKENAIPACLLRSDLIDTQVLMEYLYDLSGMIKLERAAEMAGVTAEGDVFHDARTDAEVTARLLMKLWPEFVETFGVTPIVKAAMMHSSRDTALLNPIVGKRIPPKAETLNRAERSLKKHGNGHGHSHTQRRTVRAEQQRRKRIT